MELDEHCFPQACALLHNHYRLLGKPGQLRELDARMDRHEKSLAASQVERRQVTARDTFVAHGLTETELQGPSHRAGAGDENFARAPGAERIKTFSNATDVRAVRLFTPAVARLATGTLTARW